jgi:hypothetical protein
MQALQGLTGAFMSIKLLIDRMRSNPLSECVKTFKLKVTISITTTRPSPAGLSNPQGYPLPDTEDTRPARSPRFRPPSKDMASIFATSVVSATSAVVRHYLELDATDARSSLRVPARIPSMP